MMDFQLVEVDVHNTEKWGWKTTRQKSENDKIWERW